MKSNTIKEVQKTKVISEEEWDSSDYVDIGEEEEDSEEDAENWEEGDEDWELEMEKLSKVE